MHQEGVTKLYKDEVITPKKLNLKVLDIIFSSLNVCAIFRWHINKACLEENISVNRAISQKQTTLNRLS